MEIKIAIINPHHEEARLERKEGKEVTIDQKYQRSFAIIY
jgi:hypothetical protein